MPTKSRTWPFIFDAPPASTLKKVSKATGATVGSGIVTPLAVGSITQPAYESLTYVVGPKSNLLHIDNVDVLVPTFKPVTHLKRQLKSELGYWSMLYGEDSLYRYYYNVAPMLPNLSTFTFGDLTNTTAKHPCGYNPTTIIAQVSANAPAAIKSKLLEDNSLLGFESAFNLLSFIGELRDVRKLPQLITNWRKSDKDISDKYLGVQFGILPFAGDIKSIVDRWTTLGPRIDKWNDMAANGKILNAHMNLPVPDLGPRVTRGPVDPKNPGVTTFTGEYNTSWVQTYGPINAKRYGRFKTVHEVTAKGHLYFHPVNLEESLIDDLKRSIWGVNKPLSAAWNLIPFSFVVDWFADIGSYIEEFEKQKPTLNIRIINAGYSVKVKTTITCTFGLSPGDKSCGTLTWEAEDFKRVHLSPSQVLNAGHFYGPLQFSTLSTDQSILGSALLHQLLR